jgi:transcriptional regulator with XRE-family HTH domain
MARRRAGLSQRELARRSGVPQPSISKIERGIASPTVDTLERLLRALGMELEPVEAPGEHDLDWTLIDARLELTPEERAREIVRDWQRLEAFRRARPAG